MRRGATLIELLIVVAIMIIIGTGLLWLFDRITRGRAERSSVMRNQMQVNFVVDNLVKLISSAGFGIDRNNLANAVQINNNGRELVILTRSATQDSNAGCWGIIDEEGRFYLAVDPQRDRVPISSTRGRQCPSSESEYPVRISALDKSANCVRNCLAFPNLPTTQVRLFMDTNNNNSACLPGTGRLMLDINGAGEIVSCVADLRFRFLQSTRGIVQVVDARPPQNELVGVRLCMMVQLSETGPAMGAQSIEPQYTERCGGRTLTQVNSALQNNWRSRRWHVVEVDIYMPNLQ